MTTKPLNRTDRSGKLHTASKTSLIVATLAMSACSAPGGYDGPPLEGMMPVSTDEAAHLPFVAKGQLYRASTVYFPNSDKRAILYFTPGEDLARELNAHQSADWYLVDESGNLTDWEALRNADARAFRDLHARMAPKLREQAAKTLGSGTRMAALVWFDPPLGAVIPKDVMLSLSRKEQASALETQRRTIQASARSLGQRLGEVAPFAEVHEPDGRAPLVEVQATAEDFDSIGRLDGVTAMTIVQPPEMEEPENEAFYDIDQVPYMVSHDLTGGPQAIVADFLGSSGVYDTTNLNVVPGSCHPPQGPDYACICPALAPTIAESNDIGHMQAVAGIVSNKKPAGMRGGVAVDTPVLVGNVNCSSLRSATKWALDQGGDVLNHSRSVWEDDGIFLDWTSSQNPWPFVVASAGNATGTTCRVRNGLCVGGVDDHGDSDRSHLSTSVYSWQNPDGNANGWELPNIVASAVGVLTVPPKRGTSPVPVSGTSFAAPQASGVAAALIDAVPLLNSWPEGLFAILVASPERNVTGSWPMGMNDNVDDRDGTGVLNGRNAWYVASHKYDGGNSPAKAGFDVGTIHPADLDSAGWYTEVWHARVRPGERLRVASVTFSQPSCDIQGANCVSNAFVGSVLYVNGVTGFPPQPYVVVNPNQNYMYIGAPLNTGTTDRTYDIRVGINDWAGLSSTSFGVAWASQLDTP